MQTRQLPIPSRLGLFICSSIQIAVRKVQTKISQSRSPLYHSFVHICLCIPIYIHIFKKIQSIISFVKNFYSNEAYKSQRTNRTILKVLLRAM